MREYYKAYEERYKIIHDNGMLWEYNIPTEELLEYLKSWSINKKDKILDLGCGEGRDAINLLNEGYNITAIDYSKTAIKKCNELSNYKYENKFKEFDIFEEELEEKYKIIYSISVLHMFVLEKDRIKYFDFIKNHLEKDGKAFITIMGDGIMKRSTNPNTAYDLDEREVQSTSAKVYIPKTSCCIVDWNTFEHEVQRAGLIIKRKWVSNNIPGFNESMCAILCRKK